MWIVSWIRNRHRDSLHVVSGSGARARARRTVTLDVPAGVDTGVRLHLPGSGEVGPAGGPHGDLYIEISVRHNDKFSRLKDDLLCTVDISMTDAVLGTTFTFDALDGPVSLDIKPGLRALTCLFSRIAVSDVFVEADAATFASGSMSSRPPSCRRKRSS